ncbi:transcriptional regulator, LacI family [Alkalispirochaeta americana]|uniref:Transcriptional regulator, LacI family n=1 Tax=Alkalispirochaeta americana TaxID=159291 RepID=A0A1N6R9X1_9SPIO|nr:LacI family DNA-binding transcriptional regulator [Alkalispirochaeta americana]SIQ25472.1 transcriptional regulator, LacI family [Alkalispirochaeta americana]
MTIKDIARIARVSVSTVSRSLNDSPLVAESTRRRIKAIAEDRGFEFNSGARGMVTQSVGTIGVILPDEYDEFHMQLYHSGLHNALRRALERAGLDLIVGFARNRFDGSDNVTRIVRRKKVDGLIIMGSCLERETEHYLQETRTSYVFSHYPPPEPRPDVDWVYVDHEKGGMLVGDHFLNRGHRKIVVLGDPALGLEFEQRLRGMEKALALAEPSAEIRIIPGEPSIKGGFRLVLAHQAELNRCDALFAMNDLMAIGAMQALTVEGVSVPRDLPVVGYDDIPLAESLHPSLTTVRQPSEEVAFMTCERLIEMIEDKSRGRAHQPRHVALQPQLILRESSPGCERR